MIEPHEADRPLQRRRLPSFSLRTALVVLTVFGVWLGFHVRSVKKQQAAVKAVQRHGGWAYYDYEVGADFKIDSNPRSTVPAWLLRTLGRDHFHDVSYVTMSYDSNGGRRLDDGKRFNEVLGRLRSLPNLECLSLYRAQATDESLKHVGELTSLRRLSLWDAGSVTDEGVAYLRRLEAFEYLHLNNGKISDESLRILACLPRLHGLSLQGNRFTNRGLEHIQGMVQLRELWLGRGGGKITDEGLVNLGHLKHLESLDLQSTQVTDAGLRHLVGLARLKVLCLNRTRINDVSWLQQQLPDCKISYTTGSQLRSSSFSAARLFEQLDFTAGFNAGARGIQAKNN